MTICICDISALEIYRSYGRLLPELLDKQRANKIDDCTILNAKELDDVLPRLGAKTRPYHLAVGRASVAEAKPGVIKRVLTLSLPQRSFIKIQPEVLITSPELTFCMLSTLKEIDVIDLALIGFELCGTYVLDSFSESWKGFTNIDSPITSKERILKLVNTLGAYPGARKAKKAISLVVNGSNSPMETVQAILLCFPRSLGGLGFNDCELNYKINTPDGNRYIDLAFPKYHIGLEYKGRQFHTPEQTTRDDRRQNKITSTGYTIFNVWYDDLARLHLFDGLAKDISSAMGIRLRIRSNKFADAQRFLRMKVLPSVKNYEQAAIP